MHLTRFIPALLGTVLYVSAFAAAEAVDYRLPPEIRPIAQSIDLTLDPGKPDYSGNTVLQIEVDSDVERIGIYQLGLDMRAITLRSGSDERTLESAVGEYDINWLTDGAIIPAGQYELSIDFGGDYSIDALGMHRTRFEENDYIFTQMESMYLRRAIPSFDEPSFKIPYKLIINAPAGLVVVANTPIESESEADGWQRVEFMATKPLSSYLIAYGVGPLDRAEIEGMSVPGYIYVPKGHANELGYVLQHTAPIVKSLEEYFGSNYPFRKLDFLGVPEFAFGAMENPGLITYRAEYLTLGDHTTGSMAAYVLSTIAHEVAHMWFGDLVTMEWWNDLWLNEAFASWMDEVILQRMYPEFESNLILPQTRAFQIDQGTGTKAIRKVARTEADVNEGSYLPYVKGLTLLRMLESYVGAEQWQEGVRSYLGKYAWGNATEPDLWAEISAVSGMDLSQIAGSYLNQPGFPILTLDKNGGVSQERYLPYGLEAPDLQWTIPLNVKYKKDGQIKEVFYLLDDKTGVIDLPKGADWILPDAGAEGYFRWETEIDQFYALIDDIASLENREKIALLDNSDALLRARRLSLEDYMLVVTKLLDDSHPLVLLPAVGELISIGSTLVSDDNAAAFARFVDAELSDLFAEVGIETREGDSEAMIQLRPSLVRLLGEYGSDPAVRIAAAEKADLFLESADAVDSNLASTVLRVTALNDDGERYEKYVAAYLQSADARQKTNIFRGMVFTDPAIVRKALDFAISDAVMAGDAAYTLSVYPTILNDHTVLYEWLGDNLSAFEAKIPSLQQQRLPLSMAGICNDRNLAMMREFFTDRDEKYTVSFDAQVESQITCIERRKRDGAALKKFLAQY